MSVTISTPDIADIPTMVTWGKTNRELWAGEDTGWYFPETLRDIIHNPRQDVLLIAKENGKPVGMCLAHSLRDWAYCAALFVVEEHRGHGVGKLLLKEAMKRIKKHGITFFSLLVEVHNTKAQEFYSSMGFEKGFIHQWMEKKL